MKMTLALAGMAMDTTRTIPSASLSINSPGELNAGTNHSLHLPCARSRFDGLQALSICVFHIEGLAHLDGLRSDFCAFIFGPLDVYLGDLLRVRYRRLFVPLSSPGVQPCQ